MKFKSSSVVLGRGAAVSAVRTDGGVSVVIRNKGNLIKKQIKEGTMQVKSTMTVSYQDSCILLPDGIIEKTGELSYEKSNDRRA